MTQTTEETRQSTLPILPAHRKRGAGDLAQSPELVDDSRGALAPGGHIPCVVGTATWLISSFYLAGAVGQPLTNRFQWPSETTSTAPSITVMAV